MFHISIGRFKYLGIAFDVAHHHHGREATVFGPMIPFEDLCSDNGDKQRDGGTQDDSPHLAREAATFVFLLFFLGFRLFVHGDKSIIVQNYKIWHIVSFLKSDN